MQVLEEACADPENFARGGPTLTDFFNEGEWIQIPLKATKSKASSAHQRNAI